MMRFFTVGQILLLAGLSAAQTPEGFTPEVKDNLSVIFGTKAVTSPGASLAKAGPYLPEYSRITWL